MAVGEGKRGQGAGRLPFASASMTASGTKAAAPAMSITKVISALENPSAFTTSTLYMA